MAVKKVRYVRCGLCDVVNDLTDLTEISPGHWFDCGWCRGYSVIHLVGPSGACSRRRRPSDGFPHLAWGGYVESKDVARRDAWRLQQARFAQWRAQIARARR